MLFHNQFRDVNSLSAYTLPIIITLTLILWGCRTNPAETVLTGFWMPEKYVISTGESTPVTGHISFGNRQWSVIFFMLDEEGNPKNASAKGGHYTVENNNLILWSRYSLSDIPNDKHNTIAKVVAPQEEMKKEFCTIEIEDNLLVIYFPDGNAMIFSRNV